MCIANSPVKYFPISWKVWNTLLLSLCANERNMSKMIKVCWNCQCDLYFKLHLASISNLKYKNSCLIIHQNKMLRFITGSW